MSYQSNIAREYAVLLAKAGDNPSPKQKKEIQAIIINKPSAPSIGKYRLFSDMFFII